MLFEKLIKSFIDLCVNIYLEVTRQECSGFERVKTECQVNERSRSSSEQSVGDIILKLVFTAQRFDPMLERADLLVTTSFKDRRRTFRHAVDKMKVGFGEVRD